MKVWIARGISRYVATIFTAEPTWDHEFEEWECYEGDCVEVCLQSLRKFGVKGLKKQKCKQYEIPLFREVKPRKRKARR